MTGVCTISAIRSGDPTAVNWRRRGHPVVRGNAPDQARPGGGAAGGTAARLSAEGRRALPIPVAIGWPDQMAAAFSSDVAQRGARE